MAENITQCPKCNTSFRISDAHLNSAKGAVRCGSCLYVFNAKDFLLSAKSEQEENTGSDKKTEQSHSHSDLLISDNMDSESDDPYGLGTEFSDEFNQAVSKSDTGEYDFNLFEREQAQAEEESETQDESWALDLLADDDTDSTKIEDTQEFDEEEEEEKLVTQEFDDSYYKNSFQIIEEKTPEQEAPPSSDHHEIAQAVFHEEDHIEEVSYDTPEPDEVQIHNEHAQIASNYLDAIEPEPVEFNWQDRSGFWHSKLFWAILSILAAALLTLQIAWIKFDTLSVVSPYRQYYEKGCQIFSCKLPDLLDRSKIKTANLVVRSHPQLKNALVVDAILQNNARFEQSFPVLDLIFTDKQNKIVAARRLTPAEYLVGELAGRNNMPIKQPVHIAIEISDPGRDATGYRISIAN